VGRVPHEDRKALPSNVVLAHLEEGIEAVHLYSGRTLCKLHLAPGGLHTDLNADGVLDHVQVPFFPQFADFCFKKLYCSHHWKGRIGFPKVTSSLLLEKYSFACRDFYPFQKWCLVTALIGRA